MTATALGSRIPLSGLTPITRVPCHTGRNAILPERRRRSGTCTYCSISF